jgi:hypothetical protein
MKTSVSPKVSVSERALFQRVNRKLKKNHERLCKTRGDQYRWAYYVLNTYTNTIDGKHPIMDSKADVERFARELGVLQAYEQLK